MDGVKRYVLLVDDETDIVKIVGKRFEVAGFEVGIAVDGEAVLAKVRQRAPDVLILDVMLPKLNGYEVCTILKQNAQTKRIPIIMFSGLSKEEDYWKGMNCGADAFLTKPAKFEALEQLVNRLIAALHPLIEKSREQAPPAEPA